MSALSTPILHLCQVIMVFSFVTARLWISHYSIKSITEDMLDVSFIGEPTYPNSSTDCLLSARTFFKKHIINSTRLIQSQRRNESWLWVVECTDTQCANKLCGTNGQRFQSKYATFSLRSYFTRLEVAHRMAFAIAIEIYMIGYKFSKQNLNKAYLNNLSQISASKFRSSDSSQSTAVDDSNRSRETVERLKKGGVDLGSKRISMAGGWERVLVQNFSLFQAKER